MYVLQLVTSNLTFINNDSKQPVEFITNHNNFEPYVLKFIRIKLSSLALQYLHVPLQCIL